MKNRELIKNGGDVTLKPLYRKDAKIKKNDTVYLRRVSTPFKVDVCHKDGTFTVVSIHKTKSRITIDEIDRIGLMGIVKLTDYNIKPKDYFRRGVNDGVRN